MRPAKLTKARRPRDQETRLHHHIDALRKASYRVRALDRLDARLLAAIVDWASSLALGVGLPNDEASDVAVMKAAITLLSGSSRGWWHAFPDDAPPEMRMSKKGRSRRTEVQRAHGAAIIRSILEGEARGTK